MTLLSLHGQFLPFIIIIMQANLENTELVVRSNNDSIWHYTVYVTGCDIEKMVAITSTCVFLFMCKDIVHNRRFISRGV